MGGCPLSFSQLEFGWQCSEGKTDRSDQAWTTVASTQPVAHQGQLRKGGADAPNPFLATSIAHLQQLCIREQRIEDGLIKPLVQVGKLFGAFGHASEVNHSRA
jgi:hypothetical protein